MPDLTTIDPKGGARAHVWRFFKAGGFNQARLDTGSDLLNLAGLDEKLWVALACPIAGLEIDPRTLALLDSDGDGRLRVPEILAAVQWLGTVISTPDQAAQTDTSLPLSALNGQTPDGAAVLSAAKRLLYSLGQPNAQHVSLDQVQAANATLAAMPFNGDGVLPPTSADDATLRALLIDLVNLYGGVLDRSGQRGVDAALLRQAADDARAISDWWQAGQAGAQSLWPLGYDATAAAWQSLDAVQDKIEDHFARCRTAAFDARAIIAFSPSMEQLARLGQQQISANGQELAALPLATITADAALPLRVGLNPAWADAMARLVERAIVPMLGGRQTLTLGDWAELKAKLAGYAHWLANKPATPLHGLAPERLEMLLDDTCITTIRALIDQDTAIAPEIVGMALVERTILYRRDLLRVVNNFVAFREFYGRRGAAAFQAGTLLIDQRACELCLPVADAAKHAAIAAPAGLYLLYCRCTRDQGRNSMHIVAAVTAGEADALRVGRNGVFYDRQGRDWDATVTAVVEHPIGLGQAFWAPYRQFGRFVSDQLEKFAAGKAKSTQDQMSSAAQNAAKTATEGVTPPPFDPARAAGILAAIGLGVGALGTAIATLLRGVMDLPWWQVPILLVGMMLAISGPSMLLASLKLRQRNLAPLLDACGWAINARALINIPFGARLTRIAHLPRGAFLTQQDPYAQQRRWWPWLLLGTIAVVALLVAILGPPVQWPGGMAAWFGN